MTTRCSQLAVALLFDLVLAQPPRQYAGPDSPANQSKWLAGLKAEREKVLQTINFTGGVFDQIPWTQTSWMQPQMHPYDRYFYDPNGAGYTVSKYLDDVNRRYGGIDAMLLWPTYTNIGIDDRNQFDLFRTMPGGLAGVARVTAELKAAGVRVLWPYNPWDTGTRREPLSDEDTFAQLLKQTGGDGFNGDTMSSVPKGFWDASAAVHYPLAFEPEGGGSDLALNWATMGWGYWEYPKIPAVNRFKYITRGKFMVNVCNRWAKDKTNDLQAAWFNGAGYETWENVWGTWNGITPRDAEAIRRVGHMERFFGAAANGALLLSPEWEPHTTEAHQQNVFASRWPEASAPASRMPRVLWTLVNRGGQNLTGVQLALNATSHAARWYDCYRGVELTPQTAATRAAPGKPPSAPLRAGTVGLAFDFFADDYGCVLQTGPEPPDAALATFLKEMHSMTSAPLYSLSHEWKVMHQSLVPIPPSPPTTSQPAGTVHLPANAAFTFVTKGLEIEGDDAHGVDVQFPWEAVPARNHRHTMSVPALYMDRHPVTTANYSAYRKATRYTPADPTNWLSNWRPGWPTPDPPPHPGPPSEPNYVRYPGSNAYNGHGADTPSPDTPIAGLTLRECQARCDADVNCSCVTYQREEDHGSDWLSCFVRYSCVPSRFGNGTNYDTYVKKGAHTHAQPSPSPMPPETPPPAMADWPVTYVSLREAREYCKWAGGRLPHAWEWSYAAQGNGFRNYPWGNATCDACWPNFTDGNTFTGPEPVMAHSPAGDSPFGVSDLAGNVWQYTDEVHDEHTRSVLLRGGSNYRPSGSHWYFPNRGGDGAGLPGVTHNKYMLFDDIYERAGTIGFRCVYDIGAVEEH